MAYVLYTIGDHELLQKNGRMRQELHDSYYDAHNRLREVWCMYKEEPWHYSYSSSIFYLIVSFGKTGENKILDIGRMKDCETIWDKALRNEDGYECLLELLPWIDKTNL